MSTVSGRGRRPLIEHVGGGKAALGKLASHLPRQLLDTSSARAFDR